MSTHSHCQKCDGNHRDHTTCTEAMRTARLHTCPCGHGEEPCPRADGTPLCCDPRPVDPEAERERFEKAAYNHYLARHAAGKTEDRSEPPGTCEVLLWRRKDGEYGVLMFNAAWWAWQEALK